MTGAEVAVVHEVVVVGGGIAGLTAAVHLARAGAAVTVVEAEPFAGGRCGTVGEVRVEHAGREFRFPVDHGLHGFWRQYRNLGALVGSAGLGGRLLEVPDQELVLQRGSRTYAVEVGARMRTSALPDVFASLALLTSPRLVASTFDEGPLRYTGAALQVLHALAFDPARDVGRYDDRTVADLVGDWPGWLKRLFCALTHSGFFLDPEEVSLAAFLTGLSVYTVGDKRDAGFTTLDDAAGPGLIEPLLHVVRALGGTVRLATRAERVEATDRGVRVVVRDAHGDHAVDGDAAVLALDPPGLARLALPPGVAAHLATRRVPKGVPSVAVRLFFRTAPPARRATSGIFGDARVDNFFWLDRLQRPFAAWRAATGGSVLECHLYGSRAALAASRSDDEVIAAVGAAVESGWPSLRGQRVFAHVRRNPATHVAFTPGAMRRLPTVATPSPRIALAGDFVETPWPTLYLERACLTGLLAARRIGETLALGPMPEPLRPFPVAPSVALARPVLRALRDAGIFPRAELASPGP